MIDELNLMLSSFQPEMVNVYIKAYEMFELVENSEIAYYLSLSLSTLILSKDSDDARNLAIQILQKLLNTFSECKVDD